eukprot:scaffold105915_cov89-Cyclotella_meneghiniana.AAC.1
MLNDVMRTGLECFASKGLHGRDFECREGKKFSCGPDTEKVQVSVCGEFFIQTIAAGLSQCLIVDMLNDVMWSGLECFASKGLHGLDFECQEGKKFSCGP